MTIREKDVDFQKYEDFLNNVKEQAIFELKKVIDAQKVLYVNKTRRILKASGTTARKIRLVNKISVMLRKYFDIVISDYAYVVCLFGLKQASDELKIKYVKKLSSDINGWIKATTDTISMKYFNEVNQAVTIPIIDNIGRGLPDKELLYRMNLIFDIVKKSRPNKIFNNIEGKAFFRGRDLAVRIINGDVTLKAEGFSAQTVDEILEEEGVVAAQWSAILDTHVCELCASLDGMVMDIDDPDYGYYVPGELHDSCRCAWVYIKGTERPENRIIDWKTPKVSLLKKYAKKIIGTEEGEEEEE